MKKIALLTLCLSFFALAKDSQYLIKEMEALRDSLDIDDPSRVDLTLRLADLYFDVSIKEGDNKVDPKLIQKNRLKALSLYENSLNGSHGLKKATGLNRLKIQFQMGRLLTRLDEKEKAENYYKIVYNADKSPKRLKEQAALALAEWYEEAARYNLANQYYQKTIGLCAAVQTCNYAHYRRAWLLYKDTKLDEAIVELKLSLWDQDKQIKETSLQDLIMFMSNAETDGKKELKEIRELSAKINRPELVQQLTEAFYVAGNRRAGSNLLAELNKTQNSLYYEVRLLEEFYGFRNWEKSEFYLNKISKKDQSTLPTKKEHKAEVLKILRRFIVQVDAEAQVVADLNNFLRQSIDIYLTLYPNDELRKQMQQGWLKATEAKQEKIDRLARWIKEDIDFGFKPAEIRKLRQTRLALAQEEKKSNIVIEESLALKEILKGTKEAREFTYVAGRELYSQKELDKALPLFKELADSVVESKEADKWALLSQNLALDIYNQQKKYDAIMSQVDLWRGVKEIQENKSLKKEIQSMDQIYTQANFENSASLGESVAALTAFYNFCFENVFPKKSCPNAKVLAVKLKDQDKLVSLLEKAKDEKALMTEYELMGRFSEAAKLQEKFNLNKKAKLDIYFKIALLYELDQNFSKRDLIIKKLISKVKRMKKLPKEYEGALFVTLNEAGMIDGKSLSIPWSLSRKLAIANRLESEKSTRKTRSLIMKQKESAGPAWAKLVLKKVQAGFEKASKIGFYGRSSKWKFKKRTRAIDRFAKLANSYLEGASAETRVYILQMLKTTYQVMSMEIKSTPLPEGLDDQTLNQVMVQLDEMARPFDKVAADYEKLQNEQFITLKDRAVEVKANLAKGEEDFSRFIKFEKEEVINIAQFNFEKINKSRENLAQNPESVEALRVMETFYAENKSPRLAAYFKGRIKELNKGLN